MARERRSLQDLIRGRQQSGFAGRQEQLAQYQGNLALPVEDEHRRFLFNIHGAAGAGKTYLAQQLRQAATAQGALTAYTDEAADDLTAVMTGIAAELDPDGAWQRDFEQRAAASRGRPGPGPAPAGSYLARKFGDHTDVRLLPSAAEELTPAFVTGLNRVAAGRPLALFFDTYERTSGLLDQWLRDLYSGRYGALPATLVTTIAASASSRGWASVPTLVSWIETKFGPSNAKYWMSVRDDCPPASFVTCSVRMKGRPLMVP